MKRLCDKCDALAVWNYAPGKGDVYYCEAHVPRGCSCMTEIDDDGVLQDVLDDQGRQQPCVEYNYNEKGFDPFPVWD